MVLSASHRWAVEKTSGGSSRGILFIFNNLRFHDKLKFCVRCCCCYCLPFIFFCCCCLFLYSNSQAILWHKTLSPNFGFEKGLSFICLSFPDLSQSCCTRLFDLFALLMHGRTSLVWVNRLYIDFSPFVVKYKVVMMFSSSLHQAATDLLVHQKQLTVGIPQGGHEEVITRWISTMLS